MRFRLLCAAGLLAGFSALAVAHHIPVALSSVFGSTILTEVVFQVSAGGVVPHVVGTDEHAVGLHEGAGFSVADGRGASESVSFSAADFADIHHADLHEVVTVINSQLTLAEAVVINSTLVLRGKQGGTEAVLTLTDGPSGGLAELSLGAGSWQGSKDIELVISAPEEDHGHADDHGGSLEHLPYLVFASTTPGTTFVAGHALPVALDETTGGVALLSQAGLLPGFFGELDHHGDALATFDTDWLVRLFPTGLPERVFFAYVVLSEDLSSIEFVSNRFDVSFAD